MRKFICFLLIVVLEISMTACDTSDTNIANSGANISDSTEPTITSSEVNIPDNTAPTDTVAANTDNYETIPYVSTEHDLGQWLVDCGRLGAKVPEAVRPYLNYKAIGADYCREHQGIFWDDGYVGIRSKDMEQMVEEQSTVRLMLTAAKSTSWLYLPATDEQLAQTKHDLRIEEFAQASIIDVEFSEPHLSELLPLDTITVEDANELALCLQEIKGETMKYCAVLAVEQPPTFSEALNIAMDRVDYEIVPEDMDEYGKQVLRRAGADDEIIDTVDGYMDFARLGEDSLEV